MRFKLMGLDMGEARVLDALILGTAVLPVGMA